MSYAPGWGGTKPFNKDVLVPHPPSPKQNSKNEDFVKAALEKVIKDAKEILKAADTGTKDCENYNNGFIDGIRYVFKNIIG